MPRPNSGGASCAHSAVPADDGVLLDGLAATERDPRRAGAGCAEGESESQRESKVGDSGEARARARCFGTLRPVGCSRAGALCTRFDCLDSYEGRSVSFSCLNCEGHNVARCEKHRCRDDGGRGGSGQGGDSRCVVPGAAAGGGKVDVLAQESYRAEPPADLPLVADRLPAIRAVRRGRRAGAGRSVRNRRRAETRFRRRLCSTCELGDGCVGSSGSAIDFDTGLLSRASLWLRRDLEGGHPESTDGAVGIAEFIGTSRVVDSGLTLDRDSISDVEVWAWHQQQLAARAAVCVQRARRRLLVRRAQSAVRGALAAVRLQQAWRRRRLWKAHSQTLVTSIEAGWVGARARKLGALEAHVSALQWLVRGVCQLRGTDRSGVRWAVAAQVVWSFGRRRHRPGCGFGANLADHTVFSRQRELADRWLDHYSVYVSILQRLESGNTPTVLQAYCGGGGQAEGQRRAGGRVVGTDLYDQSDFRKRFSEDAFVQGDSVDWSHLSTLRDRWRCFGCSGGPPCKSYSRARVRGEAKQPPLIEQTRDAFSSLFDLWSIENVLGARLHLAEHAAELDGALFGLRVARARLYESNFELFVDEAVRRPADVLRRGTCLGHRRRWRSFDEFGRPEKRSCCGGNIFAPLGERPWRCTADECAEAMGVDVGHMSYERLAQSVPPAYGQLVFAQMCMHRAHRRYGVPLLTFDEKLQDPAGVARQLAFWLRGAGAEFASPGVMLSGPLGAELAGGHGQGGLPPGSVIEQGAGVEASAEETVSNSLEAMQARANADGVAEFRELFFSHAGGYGQQCVASAHRSRLWDVAAGQVVDLEVAELGAERLLGANTFIEVEDSSFGRALSAAREALDRGEGVGVGTRVTFVARAEREAELKAAGFESLLCQLALERATLCEREVWLRCGGAGECLARPLVWAMRSSERSWTSAIAADGSPLKR